MSIHWVPWRNVPTHRRLELFSMGFIFAVMIALGLFSCSIIAYLLYCGNIYWKALCVLYLVFIYHDRHCGDNGGRGAGIAWIRNLSIWKYCLDYFPLDLVKTVDLPADRNYLICFFPHGILSLGAAVTFFTSRSKWPKLFPGIRSKVTTLNMNTLVPVSREFILSLGTCTASANCLTTLMEQSNDPKHESNQDGYTSNAAALIVGGAEEAFYAHPNTYKCVLKNRKGFVKIGLRTGCSLVPAISFGENNLFEVVDHEAGSWGRWIQNKIKHYTKVAPVQFYGRGYLNYDFGLVPKRQPITVVIGEPIKLEKNPKPSVEEIDRVHKIFCEKLIELFETHKSKYVENSDKVELEII